MAKFTDSYRNNQTPAGLELRIAAIYEALNKTSKWSDWLKIVLISGKTYRITDGVTDYRLEPTSVIVIDIVFNSIVPYTFDTYQIDGTQITFKTNPSAPPDLRIKGMLL